MKNVYIILSVFLAVQSTNAQSWVPIMNGISMIGGKYPGCYSIRKIGNNLYGSTSTDLYRSTDNGNTWQKKNVGSLLFYSPLSVYQANSGRLLAVGGYGYAIIKSDDNGNTWDTTMSFGGAASGQDLIITTNGNIYAAVWNNSNSSLNGIWFSTDNGNTWSVKYAFTQSMQRVLCLLRVTDSIFLAGTFYGIYRTSDAGNTWTGVALNTGSNPVTRIIKHPNGALYAATYGKGVQKSTDNGLTWAPTMVSSSSSAMYNDIDVDQNGNIYLSQYNVGVLLFNSSGGFLGVDSSGMFNKRIRDLFIDESGSSPVFYVSCESGVSEGGYFFAKGLAGAGINDLSLNKVVLFPNPTSGTFTLQTEKGGVFELMDITGKVLNTYTVNRTTETIRVNLCAGMYFIREKESGATQKLIIE